MNDLILHPKMRYGTYIISLAELWFTIRRELDHHYLHVASLRLGEKSLDHDVDIVLGRLVAQSQYHDYSTDHLAALEKYLLEHPMYEFDQTTIHRLIDQAMRVFFDTLSIHVPSLVVSPDISIKLKLVNRFDLLMTVGPNDHPRLPPN